MPTPPFTIVGSANVDMIMKVARLPERGETVTNGSFMQTYGGKGANQAVAAARAGGNVRFVACVGNDPFTPGMLDSFRRDGIDTTPIRVADDLPSGSALVMIEDSGMNYLTVAPGSNYALRPEHIAEHREWITSAGMILLQMEIPVETNLTVLAIAQVAGVPVILNYAPSRCREMSLLNGLDILVVNENEAEDLTGIAPRDIHSAEATVKALAALGPKQVILTLGVQGCVFLENGKPTHVPAFPVQPVDSTAAGDTFCGALGVALLEGKSMHEAVRFASAAAAVSVTRLGAQPSIPTRAEIQNFLETV